MKTRAISLPLLLGAAAATAAAAVADTSLGEHPTHLAVLVMVAAATSALAVRKPGPQRALRAVRMAALASIAQPILHAWATLPPAATVHHTDGGLLHIVTSEWHSAAVQIGLPIVVFLVSATAHLIGSIVGTVWRVPVGWPSPAVPSMLVPVVVGFRRDSMLSRCGWVIVAARRGPPVCAEHAAP